MTFMDELPQGTTWLKVADATYYLIAEDRFITAIEEELYEDTLRIWTAKDEIFLIPLHRLHDRTKERVCLSEGT